MNMRKHSLQRLSLLPIVILALVLPGCATLNEAECRSGDWFRIGFADGEVGHEQRAMTQHADACSDYGIRPDAAEYNRGYRAGLEYYCTLAGGLKAGRRGQLYRGICPADTLAAFQQGHRLGYEIFAVRREVDELRSHLHHLQFEHAHNCSGDSRKRGHCGPSYYNRHHGSDRVRLHTQELRLLNLERQAADMLLHNMARPDPNFR